MKHPIFTGSGVSIITPFNHERVDLTVMAQLLDFQLESKTDAVIVCETTGEASTMTYRERMRTIEFCIDYISGRVPVIAGSGSNSTEIAIALSKDAERAGANGLLVVTPYYNQASQAGLVRHYQVIADAVDSPVILYNAPSRTGVNITPESYAILAKHPNIIGTTEANRNFSALQMLRNLCPEDFYIWAGNDDETVPICALGGIGVISVVANIIPAKIHQLVCYCLGNNYKAAGTLQLNLKNLYDAMFCDVNPIPVKTALNLMGWNVGTLRLPLLEPSDINREHIKTVLQQYSLLNE